LRANKPQPRPAHRIDKYVAQIKEQVDTAAEESLRQAEEKFRTIFDNTSDGIFLLNLETRRFAMCNRSCLQMLGYTEEEFMKLSIADLHPEADLPFINTQIEEFLKGGKPIRHDIRFKRKDGSILFVDLSPDLIRLDGTRYVVVALKDITERKRMEEALAESEKKYRSLVENIPDVTWTTDQEGRTLFISSNVLNVYGYSAEEIYAGADTWLGNVHPDDRPRIEKAFGELFTRKAPYDVEYRIRRKDGNWIWLHDRSVSTYEEDGQWYADGVFSEITERKRMEEDLRRYAEHLEELVAARTGELQESEARYRSLYHTIADGVFVMGADGQIQDVNDSACAQLGYTREELVGVPVSAISVQPDFNLGEILDRLRAAGSLAYETAHRRKDGGIVPVELSVTLIEYRGRPAILGVARDITARKRAEESLRKSEEKFAKAFRCSPVAIAVTRLSDGRVIEVNEAMLKLLHFRRNEVIGHTTLELGIWVDVNDRAEYTWKLSRDGSTRGSEYRLRTKDGEIVTIHLSAELLEFSGEPCALATLVDITERKRTEEALLESEDRYRILLEHGFDGIFAHEDFRIVQLNDRLAEMTGYTRAELMGSQAVDLFTPESQERIRHYAGSGATGYFEIDLRRRDGRLVDIEAYGTSCRFQGRPARIVGLRDITERKQAQAALQESEERFRTAFEEGAVAMALTALDSTLLKVNSSFCRMLGFSESELVGRSFTEITHPDDRAANLVGIRRLASGEISCFRMEKRYIRKDGAVIWADMNTASVHDAHGRPLYCVTHVQDITDRKHAEEALRRMNEQLELQVAQRTEELRHTVDRLRQLTLELSQAEDRERKRIAAILHEDVQQMLAAARFHPNLLGSGTCSAEESQAIVEQVRQMLRDAIERSRSLSHELSPAIYQVELIEILNWLAQHMQRKHDLTVRVEAHGRVDSPSEPLKAFLYKVAQEPLFNVVKHAGVSEARVRLRRMGQSIYLSIVDQGWGFNPQELEGAAGFGLLSIRERVRLLGGQMKIRSRPGMGSRILIAVPDQRASGAGVP
jgi:PAS domain S-box-containing protein